MWNQPDPNQVLRRTLWTDHRATAFSLMGEKAPPVHSKGEGFAHMDWWTARILVRVIAAWAHENPGCQPTPMDVSKWVTQVNGYPRPDPQIVIARTPMILTLKVAKALKGGLIHELLHGVFTCKRYLTTREVAAIVLPRWARIPDWSRYASHLLSWDNLVEDIRIERCGCSRFPGIRQRLIAVNDYVLDKETPHLTANPLTVIQGAFRGIGKGYNTDLQKEALRRYHSLNPDAYEMVEAGPLSLWLNHAMTLGPGDDLGSLRVALDVVAELVSLLEQEQDKEDEEPQKAPCPKCGAPADKLKVRRQASSDKLVITCTACGHQEEIEDNPFFSPSSSGQPSDSEDEGESDEKGGGSSGEEEESHENQDSDSGGAPSEGQKEFGEENAGEGGAEGEGPLAEVAAGALESSESDLKDHQEVLSGALREAIQREMRELLPGEQPWNPASTELDIVETVKPSQKGEHGDFAQTAQMLSDVQQESAAMRSSFLMRFLDYKRRTVRHGLPSGRQLSDRYMVRTWGDLRARKKPTRAWARPGKRLDVTLAAAIVLDESYSMKAKAGVQDRDGREKTMKEVAMEGILAIVEPLSVLGCPTLVLGIRARRVTTMLDEIDLASQTYHRAYGVHYDIFKGWEETFPAVQWRFANNHAVHSTPLCDGMQMALEELADRDETHRLMFVYTDGQPNPSNAPVMRWQLRQAEKMGIHIVGVGIGQQASYVQQVFPDPVFCGRLADFPFQMTSKLDSLLTQAGRGPC